MKPSDVKIDELDELCVIWQRNEENGEWVNYPDEINMLLNIYWSVFVASEKKKCKIVYILNDTYAEFNDFEFYV